MAQTATHQSRSLDPAGVRALVGDCGAARGPPTDWGELVRANDDRDVIQASPDFTARDRDPLAPMAVRQPTNACGSVVDRAIPDRPENES